MRLKRRIALITGGTKGIGAATAVALAADGAEVALVARTKGAHVDDLQRQIADFGSRCEIIAADVSRADQALACVEETNRRLGPVDIFVHSAGGPAPGGILDIEFNYWQQAFDIHINAAFHLCRAVLPGMRERRRGALILISSAAGIRGCPANFTYQVIKGALPQFARALARDFAADNIRVNCVAPGIIRTDFHKSMTPEQQQLNLKNRIPLACEGTSEQVAELIKQLIVNDYITGETVTIDGGLTMRIA